LSQIQNVFKTKGRMRQRRLS